MIKKVLISNYKSIVKQEIDLGRVNIFIGENGSGKSNVLEAIGMLVASKCDELTTEKLFNRGIRVTKPSLTFNSFLNKKLKKTTTVELIDDSDSSIKSTFKNERPDDIYSKWVDSETIKLQEEILKHTLRNESLKNKVLFGTDFYVVRNHNSEKDLLAQTMSNLSSEEFDLIARDNPINYLKN